MRLFSRYTLFGLLAFASWIPIVLINFNFNLTGMFGQFLVFPPWLHPEYHDLYYGAFLGLNYLFIDQLIRRIEKWDVIDMMWKLLVTGVTGISLIFLFQILEQYNADSQLFPFIKTLSSSVKLYALVVFIFTTIFVYRKLILYQKNRRKVISWMLLQVVFALGALHMFLPPDNFFAGPLQKGIFPVFLIVSVFLSVNVNWSAYLNFSQKLKTLFLIFIILLLFVAYFQTFPFDAFPFISNFGQLFGLREASFGSYDLLGNEMLVIGLFFFFPLIYSLFSGLVLFFNLPTSSVFEQRSSEIATMQRINQSIQANLDEREILTTLMDASLLTSNATGGWIVLFPNEELGTALANREITYKKNITDAEVAALFSQADIAGTVIETRSHYHVRNLRKHKALRGTRTRIGSLLAVPVISRGRPVAVAFLLNELINSFEEETIASLVGLAEQAAFAIENAELIAQSIEFERFRAQARIARDVQQQILPKTFPGGDVLQFHVVTQDVEEIGGDFYDVHKEGQRFRVALGDVSGKGTQAAFYMAETKGIFQALVRLDLNVREFVIQTNRALSNCLAKGQFMTLTYCEIDPEARQVELLRAGHCPTLFIHGATGEITEHEHGAPGLGIIRSDRYREHVPQTEMVSFHPGDTMILFTDGIIEARNAEGEEFGIEKMKKVLMASRNLGSEAMAEALLKSVKEFTGGMIDDDYSILVINFLDKN